MAGYRDWNVNIGRYQAGLNQQILTDGLAPLGTDSRLREGGGYIFIRAGYIVVEQDIFEVEMDILQ